MWYLSDVATVGVLFPCKVEQAMEDDFVTAQKVEDFLVVDSNAERLIERMSQLYLEQMTVVAPTPTEANSHGSCPAEP